MGDPSLATLSCVCRADIAPAGRLCYRADLARAKINRPVSARSSRLSRGARGSFMCLRGCSVVRGLCPTGLRRGRPLARSHRGAARIEACSRRCQEAQRLNRWKEPDNTIPIEVPPEYDQGRSPRTNQTPAVRPLPAPRTCDAVDWRRAAGAVGLVPAERGAMMGGARNSKIENK
jgi:hypothetical protein